MIWARFADDRDDLRVSGEASKSGLDELGREDGDHRVQSVLDGACTRTFETIGIKSQSLEHRDRILLPRRRLIRGQSGAA